MAETKKCPKCGAELPADAPAGICPKCLMLAGLASSQYAGLSPGMKPTTLTSGFVPPEPEELAKHFPQLEILELLGKGGMGAVYKARQTGLDRLVAVKILPPEVGADPAFAERFMREARALAKLSHQNIVSVFDFGQADGLYYFVMEYVDGANLRDLIAAGTLTPQEALAIVPQICEALQFAHDEGIVHRDIKPENILLDKRGHVKIADFGLAKLLGTAPDDIALTGTHQAMGTLHYMAPEQMQGAGSVDHRADIFSLGVVFYEMLTGQLPIGKFEPPSKKVQVDVRLDEIVLRSLENEPARRYQQVSELRSDVSAITSENPVGARSVEADASVFRIQQQARMQLSLLSLGMVLAAVVNCVFAIYVLGAQPGAIQLGPIQAATRDMTFVLLFVTLQLPSVFVAVAALQISSLRSHRLAVSAAVVAMLPTGPGILIGLPCAIWALIVLNRPKVKTAFDPQEEALETAGGLASGEGLSEASNLDRGHSVVQGPADALILVASIALLTAIGVSLWLSLAPAASFTKSMTISSLKMMSIMHVVYAIVIIVAAVLMRRLRARMLVLLSVALAGIAFPAATALNVIMEYKNIPEWPAVIPMWLGVPVAVWATIVLFRQNVRAAFLVESQRRRQEKKSADIAGSVPRFSRKAILGACWAPLFVVIFLSLITLSAPRSPSETTSDDSVTVSRIGPEFDNSDSEIETVHEIPITEDTHHGPAWWQWALIVTILPLGLMSPFGTTILGAVSINDIRHSNGRLTGLPLALADALLYPLLLLDGLIVCLCWFLCVVTYEIFGPGTAMNERAVWICIGITILLSLPACAYVDFRITRAAWRRASGQPDA